MLPTAIQFGVDPVHFGVIMVLTLVLGLITPPVGAVLFVATAISRISIERLSVVVLPFLAVLFVLTLVVAYVPELSLWLPRTFAP
jgi:TRAP-type C4-dicarboxylate transport system permease large subunit